MADKCEECINRMMSTAANQHPVQSVFLVEFYLFIDLLDKITGWVGPGLLLKCLLKSE